jgi:hypothetical protein
MHAIVPSGAILIENELARVEVRSRLKSDPDDGARHLDSVHGDVVPADDARRHVGSAQVSEDFGLAPLRDEGVEVGLRASAQGPRRLVVDETLLQLDEVRGLTEMNEHLRMGGLRRFDDSPTLGKADRETPAGSCPPRLLRRRAIEREAPQRQRDGWKQKRKPVHALPLPPPVLRPACYAQCV